MANVVVLTQHIGVQHYSTDLARQGNPLRQEPSFGPWGIKHTPERNDACVQDSCMYVHVVLLFMLVLLCMLCMLIPPKGAGPMAIMLWHNGYVTN